MKLKLVLGGALVILASACGASTESSQLSTGSASSPRAAVSPLPTELPATTPVSGDISTLDEPSSTGTTTASSQSSPTPKPPEESPVTSQPTAPNVDSQVAEAVADLAIRLGVDESTITLVANDRVTWPDGSLGCPQPGMSYTQSLVDGSLIVLEVEGLTYEYHSGKSGSVFYCATPTPPVPGDPGDR